MESSHSLHHLTTITRPGQALLAELQFPKLTAFPANPLPPDHGGLYHQRSEVTTPGLERLTFIAITINTTTFSLSFFLTCQPSHVILKKQTNKQLNKTFFLLQYVKSLSYLLLSSMPILYGQTNYSWHPFPFLGQPEQIQASEERNHLFQLLLPPNPHPRSSYS